MSIRLNELTEFPRELLTTPAHQLKQVLGGPTLIYLQGRRDPPLFVSVLQHGNEISGYQAVQRLMGRYLAAEEGLPRSLYLFIGNVAAAEQGLRHLPTQEDFNRCWNRPHTQHGPLLAQVTEKVLANGLFASIDIHNNTGRNPHYACISQLDPVTCQLAALFGRTVVYFLEPRGAQSVEFSQWVKALTIECGVSGLEAGAAHAAEMVDACLHMESLPERPVPAQDMDIYHTIARIEVDESCPVAFADEPSPQRQKAAVILRQDLDALNFTPCPKGTVIGRVQDEGAFRWQVCSASGAVTLPKEPLVRVEGQEWVLHQDLYPSMFTKDKDVIHKDCLGYLMIKWPP